jgi:hypothetical protein
VTRLFRSFAVLSVVLGLAAIIGLVFADTWYRDDTCDIEEWKCDAGALGIGLLVFCGPPAVVLGSATLLMLIAGRHRG